MLKKIIARVRRLFKRFWRKIDEQRKIAREDKLEAAKEAEAASAEITPRMEEAKKLGIPYDKYRSCSCEEMTDEQLKEFGKILKARRKSWKEDYEFYLSVLQERLGWDRERAEQELARAKDNGISYQKYMQKAGWECSDAELARLGKLISRDGRRIRENTQMYVDKICAATGWNRGTVHLEVNRCKNRTGASYEDYFVFKLYELPQEKHLEYVTFGLFTKIRLKYNDLKIGQKFFDNKEGFNKCFADLINRKWFVNYDLTYSDFLKHIEGLKSVIVKALAATQGKGVYKFDVNVSDEENRRVYEQIIALPRSIVEEYIVQHDSVAAFCPSSVNTLRITTLNVNGECHFLYSVFRMGQGAVVDNFHAGGIAASVNLETGEVITDAADLDANVFPVHPKSGLPIKGFVVPHWDKILETCRKASGRVKGVNLVGWDFAITPDGVDLIEGNPGASYVVAQIPFIKDRIGLRATMVDPYL